MRVRLDHGAKTYVQVSCAPGASRMRCRKRKGIALLPEPERYRAKSSRNSEAGSTPVNRVLSCVAERITRAVFCDAPQRFRPA